MNLKNEILAFEKVQEKIYQEKQHLKLHKIKKDKVIGIILVWKTKQYMHLPEIYISGGDKEHEKKKKKKKKEKKGKKIKTNLLRKKKN